MLFPSVALAVQHCATLTADLAGKQRLQRVCSEKGSLLLSPETCHDLATAAVLVATHGAYLRLLENYPDYFSMDNLH